MHQVGKLDVGYAPVLLQFGEDFDVDLVELHGEIPSNLDRRMAIHTGSIVICGNRQDACVKAGSADRAGL